MDLSCMLEIVFRVVFLSFLFPFGCTEYQALFKSQRRKGQKRKENNEGKIERKAELELKISAMRERERGGKREREGAIQKAKPFKKMWA